MANKILHYRIYFRKGKPWFHPLTIKARTAYYIKMNQYAFTAGYIADMADDSFPRLKNASTTEFKPAIIYG